MIPWVRIDFTDLPGGEGRLRLMQRGDEFSIMLGSNELMNSRVSGSEEALATLSCQIVGDRGRARILIGGLGMGFTLRSALAQLGNEARVVVAELLPAIVAWARGPMAPVFGSCLADPRVTILEEDVVRSIGSDSDRYDAILLDVDNGPQGLTSKSNDRLYDDAGLRHAWTALTDGGVLAVWSSGPDRAFTRRLVRADFSVREVKARGRRGGARHVIWLAVKGGPKD